MVLDRDKCKVKQGEISFLVSPNLLKWSVTAAYLVYAQSLSRGDLLIVPILKIFPAFLVLAEKGGVNC